MLSLVCFAHYLSHSAHGGPGRKARAQRGEVNRKWRRYMISTHFADVTGRTFK